MILKFIVSGIIALSFSLLSAISSAQSTKAVVIGGFDSTRGGFESLENNTQLYQAIATAYPRATFKYSSVITSEFLSQVNVVILGVAAGNETAISPLTAAEQSALSSFVRAGGTALIFTDNSTFDPNAPTANASLLAPFGVTATGTIHGTQFAPLLNLAGPLTSPFSPVTDFETSAPGWFVNAGTGTVLAKFAENENAIVYFAPGDIAQGSGAVVLFADSNGILFLLSQSNADIVLNAISLANAGVPTIASLQPGSLDAGSAALTLTVNGSKFDTDDTVEWNGVPMATTFVSASKLTAKVSAADVGSAGSAAVTVVEAADGATSKPALFTIPLTSIVIASQAIKTESGGYSITLTLKNSGFNAATDVSLTGACLGTTATSSALPIDITSIAPNGSKTVTLNFPASAGKAGTQEFLLLYGSYAGGGFSLSSLETLP